MILQASPLFGLSLTVIITLIIIIIIFSIIIYAIFLKFALSFVESSNHNFSYLFITAVLCALVGIIPCIGCILQWLIINYRHETGFGRAILVWLLAIIIGFIIVLVIALVIITILFGIPFILV
ncbi:MAG: hypothetical protein ACFFAH_01040 [Promethearchaeota archaeon]